MFDFNVTREELADLTKNAHETMGGLFEADRYKLSFEERLSRQIHAWLYAGHA